MINKIRDAYESESPELGTLLKQAGFSDEQLSKLRDAYELGNDQAFGSIVMSGPGRPQSERERLGLTREEYGQMIQQGTEQETRKAMMEAEAEESPLSTAFFPRVKQAQIEGDTGSGSAVLDLASLPFRALTSGLEGAAVEATDQFTDEDLSGYNAMFRGMSQTGSEDGQLSIGDVVASQNPVIEGEFAGDPEFARQERLNQPWYQDVARGATTDPLNAIPGGAFVAGAKQLLKVPGLGPILKKGGQQAKALAKRLGYKSVDEAKLALEQARKAQQEALGEASEQGFQAVEQGRKAAQSRALKDGTKGKYQEYLDDPFLGTGDDAIRLSDDANSIIGKSAQDVAQARVATNKAVNRATNQLSDAEKSVMSKLARGGAKATGLAAEEGTLETGRQLLEDGDVSMGEVMLSSALPVAGQTVKAGFNKLAKGQLANKLNLPRSATERRYGANTDIIVDENMVPYFSGSKGILSAIDDKVADTQYQRNLFMDANEQKYLEGQENLDKLKAINTGNPPMFLNDNIAVVPGWIPGKSSGFKTEKELVSMGFDPKDVQGGGFIMEKNPKTGKFVAEENVVDEMPQDLIDYIESGVPSGQMFAEARKRVFADVTANKISNQEAQKLINELNIEEANMAKFADKGGLVNLPVVTQRAKEWFERGKVNRDINRLDPTAPKAQVGELMWNVSREHVNEVPGMAETGKEFAKYLPLQESVAKAVARAPKSSKSGIIASVLESNPFINETMGAGRIGERFKRGGSLGNLFLSTPKQALKQSQEDEEN